MEFGEIVNREIRDWLRFEVMSVSSADIDLNELKLEFIIPTGSHQTHHGS